MKRVATLILAFLMVFPLFACDNTDPASGGDDTTSTGAPEQIETTDVLDLRSTVPDNIPVLDFKGADFRVVTQTRHAQDVLAEEQTGDIINDTIYKRNKDIEDRFNIKITLYHNDYESMNTYASKSILAQDDAIDLFCGQAVATSSLVLQGLMMPWQNVQYIDFTQPWWSKSTTDDLTVNGKTYVAIGAYSLSSLYSTYCMYYDKAKAADYNIPDIYEIVKSGKWTLAKLSELTRNIYEDVNGDGQRDLGDFYGFATDPNSNLDAYLWAFDNPVMKKNASGVPELAIKTDKINTICTELYDLLFVNPGSYSDYKYVGEYGYSAELGRDFFRDGKCLFANATIERSITSFKGLENDYGIIPYPKFDENQKSYKTMADGSHAVLAVPMTVTDTDKVGAVTEALCAESWKHVYPAYYDVALKVKGARDPASIEMLDMIVDGRVFDFGYIYDNWQGMSFCLERIFIQGNSNFESYYDANEAKVRTHYAKVLEYFDAIA